MGLKIKSTGLGSGKGWRNEPIRHGLARKGVKTVTKENIIDRLLSAQWASKPVSKGDEPDIIDGKKFYERDGETRLFHQDKIEKKLIKKYPSKSKLIKKVSNEMWKGEHEKYNTYLSNKEIASGKKSNWHKGRIINTKEGTIRDGDGKFVRKVGEE